MNEAPPARPITEIRPGRNRPSVARKSVGVQAIRGAPRSIWEETR